jgi:carbamate kinase
VQQQAASEQVPAQPLHSLGAMTQGQLGSIVTLALHQRLGRGRDIVSVVTHVVVDEGDHGFAAPTKPIGPFYDKLTADSLTALHGWTMIEDSGRGYRRVVASPEPGDILEAESIRVLIDSGAIVVACGGGGIPVATQQGHWTGVDAVIDKDLMAARLAWSLQVDTLALVTGVPTVQLDFGTPAERPLYDITVADAQQYLADGQFPAGSMGPKITAALRFVRATGGVAAITTPERLLATLNGSHDPLATGTRVLAVPCTDVTAKGARQ